MPTERDIIGPQIVVTPPGPKTRELIQRKSLSFTKINLGRIAINRALGALLEDIDGNIYLDFGSDINAVGHNNPKVVSAIRNQIDNMIGASPVLTLPFIDCAEKLKEMLPGELKKGKIAYATTGSETIDLATRLARGYTKRKLIISFHGCHFGEGTSDCSRLAGDYKPRYKGGLVPLVSETLFAPWPYCYRCPFGHSLENCNLFCLSYFDEILNTFSPEDIAAVILEGLPANGGILIPPLGYIQGLRSICNEHGIMFLVDEVFSGFGKTGKFLAIENWNVAPDIVCMGKAMGGGLPISAVATRDDVIDRCDFLALGTQGSFSGNIVSCAAAIATMNVIQAEGLLEKAFRLGVHMKRRLEELAERHEVIGDTRGIGLINGIELVKDKKKTPATELAELILQEAFRRGLLITRCGRYGNVLRMTPHLVTTKEQIDLGLDIFEESMMRALL